MHSPGHQISIEPDAFFMHWDTQNVLNMILVPQQFSHGQPATVP